MRQQSKQRTDQTLSVASVTSCSIPGPGQLQLTPEVILMQSDLG